MVKWIKGLVVGLSICAGLLVFGIPSTAHAAYKYTSNMGFKVPKQLLGYWYTGSNKFKFTGYKKSKDGKKVITRHSVNDNDYYVGNKRFKVKAYYDGFEYYKYGFDFGYEYVPLIFSYNGHKHKGLDVTGHGPDLLYTRVKTKDWLSLNGLGGDKKVKLVHFGF